MAKRSPLARRLEQLERFHGPPPPLPTTDPFGLVLWENVAYLAKPDARARAFARLQAEVGLRPADILGAPRSLLLDIAGAGIKREIKAAAMREAAEIVVRELDGDLAQVCSWPVTRAVKMLKKLPAIGEPGAKKILLFSGAQPLFTLESNGLRVLLRLGYGEEAKSYATTYRSVAKAVAAEIVEDVDWLTRAHLLLKKHGEVVCKRSAPACETCPLTEHCAFFARQG
jgi:endonuclease-3